MAFDATETVWRRARLDTRRALHTFWFWVYELAVVAALGIGVATWRPPWAAEGLPLAIYQGFVPIAGAFAGLGVVYILAAAGAPSRQRDEARAAGVAGDDTHPNITVKTVVGEGRAVLAVHNRGAQGDFTAHGRVLDEISNRGSTGYIAYWEGNHGRTCHIDQGGDAEILLGRIADSSSGASAREAIYNGGLMLYRMGGDGHEQPFGAYRTITTDVGDGGTATRVEDACTVEVTITSTPPLRTPWEPHQYQLRAQNGDMQLTEVTGRSSG